MDLKQLQYFITVAELESFTRASEALGVAQPALSRQIRLLEVELRQNLLIRNGRGAIPTDAGKLLLGHARGIHHQLERAREELLHMRGGLTGRVALGLPPSLARALTVPLTRAFRVEMPDAQLTIREGLSTAMQEGLKRNYSTQDLISPCSTTQQTHQVCTLSDSRVRNWFMSAPDHQACSRSLKICLKILHVTEHSHPQ
jgi:DNA-binding transcriptional LysR family regulator